MPLSYGETRLLLEAILDTRDDEIGCDDALAGTAALAELEARHSERPCDAAGVSRHLDDCPECAEEYASLLAALIERPS